jgi:hypothetical protein
MYCSLPKLFWSPPIRNLPVLLLVANDELIRLTPLVYTETVLLTKTTATWFQAFSLIPVLSGASRYVPGVEKARL